MSGINEIIVFFNNLKEELEGEIRIESISPKVVEIPTILDEVQKTVIPWMLEEYTEFFSEASIFYNHCKNQSFLVENLQEVYDSIVVLRDCFSDLNDKIVEQSGHCPCCGKKIVYHPLDRYYEDMIMKYSGNKMRESETLNRKKYTCPQCGSSDRDRMIVAYLKKIGLSTAPEGLKVLHIAPSRAIDLWIKEWCPLVCYETTDMFMEGVTFRADIQDMNMVEDETYDVIICSHVLEHVQNDRQALSELKRVLKDDGQVVFLVPIELERTEIDEEWGLSEEENWRRFGQGDYCRAYSKAGLVSRLEEHFFVHQLGKQFFGASEFHECGLTDTSTLYVLTKNQNVELDKTWKPEIDRDLCENGPLVSVIMPCYNHEKYVKRAIESVLNQSYRNIEFIVCDDASTDRTPEILKEYSRYFSKEFYFENNTGNRGQFLAEQTSGKYVALMHSDDVWDENKLAIQVEYLEKNGGICLTWADYIADDESVVGGSIFYKKNRSRVEWLRHFWSYGNCLCNPSSIMRRDLLLREQKHGEGCKQLPDYFKWIDYVCDTEIHIIPLPLTKMGIHYEGESVNESAPSPENNLRSIVEDGIVWTYILDDMDNALFKEAFGEFFEDVNSSTNEELMCERFFMLRNHPSIVRQTSAMYYLQSHYNEMKKCLHEKYNYIKTNLMEDEVHKGFMSYFK